MISNSIFLLSWCINIILFTSLFPHHVLLLLKIITIISSLIIFYNDDKGKANKISKILPILKGEIEKLANKKIDPNAKKNVLSEVINNIKFKIILLYSSFFFNINNNNNNNNNLIIISWHIKIQLI